MLSKRILPHTIIDKLCHIRDTADNKVYEATIHCVGTRNDQPLHWRLAFLANPVDLHVTSQKVLDILSREDHNDLPIYSLLIGQAKFTDKRKREYPMPFVGQSTMPKKQVSTFSSM